MVITGFHIAAAEVEERRSPKGPRTQTPNDRVKRLMNTSTKVKIEFDLPRRLKDEEIQLNEAASTHRTMVDAVQLLLLMDGNLKVPMLFSGWLKDLLLLYGKKEVI